MTDRYTRLSASDESLRLIVRALECLALFEDAVGDRKTVYECERLQQLINARLLDGAET